MRLHRSHPRAALAGAVLASLAVAPAGGQAAGSSPIPPTAELRALWGGGTWKSDAAPGGGMFSRYKPGDYFNPDKSPENPMPLNAEAAARYRHIREEYGKGRAISAPYAECHPAGMPYILALDGYGGYAVVVGTDKLIMLHGDGEYRRIWLRGHVHPDPARKAYPEGDDYPSPSDPTYEGDSIAHWDGATMVVDTVNIKGEHTQIEPHFPKPEGSHIVERYTPISPGLIGVEFTMTNPAFTRPWTVKFQIHRDPNGKLKENHCTDGNRWAMDPKEGLIMRGPDGRPLEKAED